MTAPHANTLVLALGNTLRGDDGVGAAVIAALRDQQLPAGVTLQEGGTPGLELVLMMQGYRRVIVVDAADMDQPPGTCLTFTPEQVRLQSRDMHLRGTLHYAGLAEALSLGDVLGLLPPEIIIIGVQPLSLEWQIGLSEPITAALPDAVAAVMDALLYDEA